MYPVVIKNPVASPLNKLITVPNSQLTKPPRTAMIGNKINAVAADKNAT